MNKIGYIICILGLFTACTEEVVENEADQFTVTSESEGEMDKTDLLSLAESDPNNIQLWINLGRFCKENLDFACALDAGAKSFRLDSTNLEARSLYAWTLINKPEPPLIDIERAKRHYKYVLAAQPKNKEVLVELGNAYSLTGDFEAAFTHINNALRIDEEYRDAYILKGSIYRVVENYDLALSSYQTAVRLDPGYFMSNLQTGYLLTEMENHQLALEYYQNAAEIDPASIEALYGVAKSFQDAGQYDEAQVVYREILEIDPSFFISYFNQGFIKQYYVHELDSAVYYYNKCLTKQPEYVKAWHQLGETYYMQERYADAAKAFTEVLHLNPDYEPTLRAKEKLRNKPVK